MKKEKCNSEDPDLSSMSDEEEQRLMRNAEIVRTMPDNIADVLMKARKKPVWCSDMRWRMELSRRRKFSLYL